jgi:hypothetical protein
MNTAGRNLAARCSWIPAFAGMTGGEWPIPASRRPTARPHLGPVESALPAFALAPRLGAPSFAERAKPEAVEKARADHAEKASDADKYRAAPARLG